MYEASLEVNGFKFCMISTMHNKGVMIDPIVAQFDNPKFIEALKIACEMQEPYHYYVLLNEWLSTPWGNIKKSSEEELGEILEWYVKAMQNPQVAVIVNESQRILTLVENTKAELQRRVERNEEKIRALQRRQANQDGFVYLIRAETGHFKIGRTRKPNDRIATFEVKLPFDVEYLAVIQTANMYQLESELHNRFSSKRVRGEWFALDANDVAYIKSLEGGAS